ncbi:MAG: hypothetical protein PF569_01310 [Candidatus Woesearchaeota archaeon]|jgi:hypothetical protein|nr:hypothetical protein [Candidatus Woesearchaeota archaeon]
MEIEIVKPMINAEIVNTIMYQSIQEKVRLILLEHEDLESIGNYVAIDLEGDTYSYGSEPEFRRGFSWELGSDIDTNYNTCYTGELQEVLTTKELAFIEDNCSMLIWQIGEIKE